MHPKFVGDPLNLADDTFSTTLELTDLFEWLLLVSVFNNSCVQILLQPHLVALYKAQAKLSVYSLTGVERNE